MEHDRAHNGPYDRGGADYYYGRRFEPHKYVGDAAGKLNRVILTHPDEIAAYRAGYEEEIGRKNYD